MASTKFWLERTDGKCSCMVQTRPQDGFCSGRRAWRRSSVVARRGHVMRDVTLQTGFDSPVIRIFVGDFDAVRAFDQFMRVGALGRARLRRMASPKLSSLRLLVSMCFTHH